MSKLRCICDHIIVDQSFHLPYKAEFIPDEDGGDDMEAVADALTASILAREKGQGESFLRTYFGEDWSYRIYPPNSDAESILSNIVFDMITGVAGHSGRLIYECEQCGRLWVQKHVEYDKNVYGSYVPEGAIRGALQSQHKRKEKGTDQ